MIHYRHSAAGVNASLPAARAVVITVSDSVARGARADASGPEACRLLRAAGLDVDGPEVVADDRAAIAAAIRGRGRALRAGGDHGRHGPGGAGRDARGHGRRSWTAKPRGSRSCCARTGRGRRRWPRWPGAGRAWSGTCLVVNLPGSSGGRARRPGGAPAAPAARVVAAGGPYRARAGRYWIHEEKEAGRVRRAERQGRQGRQDRQGRGGGRLHQEPGDARLQQGQARGPS